MLCRDSWSCSFLLSNPPAHRIVRVALLDAEPTVIGRIDYDVLLAQGAVGHAREDALINILGLAVAGDHSWKCIVVAIVHDLEQFLTRPGGRILGSEVVKNQQRYLTDGLEAVVILDLAGRAKGRTQMVEQIGNDCKEHAHLTLERDISDRRREVGLAGAIV